LLTFEATLQPEGTALLNWTSQNESNLAYYIVEKSINGVQWNQLTRQTAGGTGHSYTVTDPRPGTNFTYYRLRLVNQNNNYNYSPIRRIGTEENLQAGLQLFPNPLLDNTLHFEYQTPITGVLLIKIYDYLGREHAVLVRNVTKGNNPFYFELKNLASGFYILQVIQEKETQQVKFVKR
ncbi:MAG: type sorting protein, partial [Adhaeribacter sp.]|nr:type sorting protein [Adhaeribacter sp.]